MSALDTIARGLAAQNRTAIAATAATAVRAATIARLARGVQRTGLKLPGLAASPPTIGTISSTSTLTSGATLYAPYLAGVATHVDKYSLMRGTWRIVNASYPLNSYIVPDAVTQGDGTAGGTASNPVDGPGSLVRCYTAAPALEIAFYNTGSTTSGGFRVRVDGDYIQSTPFGFGVSSGGGSYLPITFGDGSASNRKMRLIEIEGLGQFKFGGIKCLSIYQPYPAAAVEGVRGIVHGDSFVGGSGSTATAMQPPFANQIALLMGQPDVIASSVGGTGFIANLSGTKNNFQQRVQADVIARTPDFIVELGGIGDENLISGSAAVMQGVVTTWLQTVIAALPNVVIFMTGPMSPGTPTANRLLLRDGKKAAAALFPNNVIFIDNLAENWVTGTGKIGAATGTGNADWVTSSDGTHPADDGQAFLALMVAQAVAARLRI